MLSVPIHEVAKVYAVQLLLLYDLGVVGMVLSEVSVPEGVHRVFIGTVRNVVSNLCDVV